MAKDITASLKDALAFEQAVQELPEFPTRPALYISDFPTGELADAGQAKFQMERSEREWQLRQAQSGHLAQPYGYCGGAQTPQELALELERQEDVRRYRNGLPDSPEDMPPRVGDKGRPF
jgi:hypothetical protein